MLFDTPLFLHSALSKCHLISDKESHLLCQCYYLETDQLKPLFSTASSQKIHASIYRLLLSICHTLSTEQAKILPL
jgi:hypothetical protein